MDLLPSELSPHRILLPEGWPAPRGYSHGMQADGIMIALGGQIGILPDGTMQAGFLAQCERALRNIAALLAEAQAGPEHLVRLTWYVTDMDAYLGSLRELGEIYRSVMAKNYPVMSLVQVIRLVEPSALVEIEATAVLPRG